MHACFLLFCDSLSRRISTRGIRQDNMMQTSPSESSRGTQTKWLEVDQNLNTLVHPSEVKYPNLEYSQFLGIIQV